MSITQAAAVSAPPDSFSVSKFEREKYKSHKGSFEKRDLMKDYCGVG